MAHGLNSVILKRASNTISLSKTEGKNTNSGGIGSRRIFAPQFKLQVLDSYRNDSDCKGNQRATARKYGIHRRQIQKWLQVETNLRSSVMKTKQQTCNNAENDAEARKCIPEAVALSGHRLLDDTSPVAYSRCATEADTILTEQRVPFIRTSPVAYSETPCEQRTYTQPSASVLPLPAAIVTTNRCSPVTHNMTSLCNNNISPSSPVASTVPTGPLLSPQNDVSCQAALDFSTRTRYKQSTVVTTVSRNDESFNYDNRIPSPCSSPIDLSFRKHSNDPSDGLRIITSAPFQTYYPVDTHRICESPIANSFYPICHMSEDSDNRVWDLSLKNASMKRSYDESNCPEPSSFSITNLINVKPMAESPSAKQKPVKLFKPYLDEEYSSSSSNAESKSLRTEIIYTEQIIKEEYVIDKSKDSICHNNNNMMIDKRFDVPYSKYEESGSFYNPGYHYEFAPHYDFEYCSDYQSDEYGMKSITTAVKQRQSYSLNFKLSAIESYYNDEICKGNQRAVASKYKIHRRQVQKWLKQEDELREKIMSTKQIHAVR